MSETLPRASSPDTDRRRPSSETSKSPRYGKHHESRSRSRSRDRKHKSSDKKHRRSRSRSKEARRRDSEKVSKSQSRLEESHDERGRERLSEDNGEDRHRRKDKKSSRGRSCSRSRSRERRYRSRSRDKKRSRSRSRDRRSKSREKKRRARSRSSSRSKHRHRSRSRSKSRDKKKRMEKNRRKSRSRSPSPLSFRGRNKAMDAQEALARRLERAKKLQEQREKDVQEKHHQQDVVAGKEKTPVKAVSAPAPLLREAVTPTASATSAPKTSITSATVTAAAAAAAAAAASAAAANPVLNVAALLASGTQVTPQIAMAAQMAALQAKTMAETGISVPSYYNPSAVNPMKFAEQEKKRKLLWQGKKEGDSKSQTAELWEKLNFGNKDQNVKFRKLMGIKEEEAGASGSLNEDGLKTLQQQEEMFRNLDVQYEMARSQTHTQRGMGLGFGSSFSRGMDAL